MPCTRVQQHDAAILDDEIAGIMRESTTRLFDKFRPGLVESLAPEINALIRSFIFTCSTFIHKPTPGMKLQNVKFCQSAFRTRTLFAYYILTIAMPYMWKRFPSILTTQRTRNYETDTSRTRWQISDFVAYFKRLEVVISACQFLNLLAFLKHGRFRSFEERLLGMGLKSTNEQSCMISYEPITRQQLWKTFTDLGSTFLPLFVFLYRRVASKLKQRHKQALTMSSDCCLLCGIPPQTPYITSCNHVYCYYCLYLSASNDANFACVACGKHFQSSKRLITG
ncbi:hypothetical protein ABG067_001811 [Albugo candida]